MIAYILSYIIAHFLLKEVGFCRCLVSYALENYT